MGKHISHANLHDATVSNANASRVNASGARIDMAAEQAARDAAETAKISAPCGKVERGNGSIAPLDGPSSELAPQTQPTAALSDAFAACKAIRDLDGPVENSRWNRRALEMLPNALKLVNAYSEAVDGYQVLAALWKSEKRRLPAKEKLKIELIAVKSCMHPLQSTKHETEKAKRKADQTECSRFANVVKVAVHRKIAPEGSVDWLKQQKLNALVAEARLITGGSCKRPSPRKLPLYEADYPVLNAVLLGKDDGERSKLKAALTEVEKTFRRKPSPIGTSCSAAPLSLGQA